MNRKNRRNVAYSQIMLRNKNLILHLITCFTKHIYTIPSSRRGKECIRMHSDPYNIQYKSYICKLYLDFKNQVIFLFYCFCCLQWTSPIICHKHTLISLSINKHEHHLSWHKQTYRTVSSVCIFFNKQTQNFSLLNQDVSVFISDLFWQIIS